MESAEGSAAGSLGSRHSGETGSATVDGGVGDGGTVQPALPDPDDDEIQPLAPELLDGPDAVISAIQQVALQA